MPTIASILLPDPGESYVAWLIAALTPWAAVTPPPAPKPSKGRPPPPIPVLTAREGIKASNRVATIISAAASNAEKIQSFQRQTLARLSDAQRPAAQDADEAVGRDTVGMTLRTWGASWRMQVLLALLLELVRADAHDTAAGMFVPSSAAGRKKWQPKKSLLSPHTQSLMATLASSHLYATKISSMSVHSNHSWTERSCRPRCKPSQGLGCQRRLIWFWHGSFGTPTLAIPKPSSRSWNSNEASCAFDG